MKARVVSIDPEEGGLVVLEHVGGNVNAMNCLGYGRQSMPEVGAEIEVQFNYMSDDEDWNNFYTGNQDSERKLVRTGLWSYVVFGQLIPAESASEEQAEVDCGVFRLPAPLEVVDHRCIGSYVTFTISRLDAWHKSDA